MSEEGSWQKYPLRGFHYLEVGWEKYVFIFITKDLEQNLKVNKEIVNFMHIWGPWYLLQLLIKCFFRPTFTDLHYQKAKKTLKTNTIQEYMLNTIYKCQKRKSRVELLHNITKLVKTSAESMCWNMAKTSGHFLHISKYGYFRHTHFVRTMATASLRTLSPNTKMYISTSTLRSWNTARTVTELREKN